MLARARGGHGAPNPASIQSCQEALQLVLDAPDTAREYVLRRRAKWIGEPRDENLIPWEWAAVVELAERSYAAAVLLATSTDLEEDQVRVWGMLAGIKKRLCTDGRHMNTIEGAALVALLAMIWNRGLFDAATLRLDDGEAVPVATAVRAWKEKTPDRVTCVSGRVALFVDGIRNGEITIDAPAGLAEPIRLETNGARVNDIRLGDAVTLIVEGGPYEPGRIAIFRLPPCLALEEGGVRRHAFELDFAGKDSFSIPLRATTPIAAPKEVAEPAPNVSEEIRMEWLGKLIHRIDVGSNAGKPLKGWLTIENKAAMYPLLSADEKNLQVEINKNAMPLRWAWLKPTNMAALAKSLATENDAESQLMLGVLLISDGQTKAAEEAFARAAQIDPPATAKLRSQLTSERK